MIEKNSVLLGITDSYLSKIIIDLKDSYSDFIVVTSTEYEAYKVYRALSFFDTSFIYLVDNYSFKKALAISPERNINNMDMFYKIQSQTGNVIVTHIEALLTKLPNPKEFYDSKIVLKKGAEINRDNLIEFLSEGGYERSIIVNNPGEFAIRGFVIDIYPSEKEDSLRIEFFGDEIVSIREFDPLTQLSKKEIIETDITLFKTDLLLKESNLMEYFDKPLVILKDLSQIKKVYDSLVQNIGQKSYENEGYFKLDVLTNQDKLFYNELENIESDITIKYHVSKIKSFNSGIELINEYIRKNLKEKNIVLAIDRKDLKRIKKYLEFNIFETNFSKIKKGIVNFVDASMTEGFLCDDLIVLTKKELFNEVVLKNRIKKVLKNTESVKLNTLKRGDYVVHALHGIGQYQGITTLKNRGMKKDYLEIKYAKTDKLYVPVERIDYLKKYLSKDHNEIKLDSLGSTSWIKRKNNIRKRLNDIAQKLIKLYAERKMEKGFAFSEDDVLQQQFEEDFAYTPTFDQIKASEEIKSDMEKAIPMERLLCGDVGFGKTEVAFRAMFKAVKDTKQVLYLCPTTILSNQQYESALKRFKNYGVNISLLNRFIEKKKQVEILDDFQKGKIDILIGTHRLLSKDIVPYDLGLLIIDEEQRFGVRQKEKIKKRFKNIDILSLSATPIPRTLQISLMGIRGLSLIETPPLYRLPIQTYVIEEDEKLIKDAIYKEASRGGQVFVLFNNIEQIEIRKVFLENIVPDLDIVVAHGKLKKEELERRINDFIDKKYDILLCTSIIETGIDIPNVNTLIVLNADHFGLSQLYQIRGRVGRSTRQAYAYLMYSKNKILTPEAQARLNSIKEFINLGSGYKIASNDLKIRGAGDVFGSEQAGFIDTVGIDLYLKILDEEIERIKTGKVPKKEVQATPLINVQTSISEDYTEEEEVKILIHEKINSIKTEEDLLEIQKEIKDRFGTLDEDLNIYMYSELFESIARVFDLTKVYQTQKEVVLYFEKGKIDPAILFKVAYETDKSIKLIDSPEYIKVIFKINNFENHFIYKLTEFMMKLTEEKKIKKIL